MRIPSHMMISGEKKAKYVLANETTLSQSSKNISRITATESTNNGKNKIMEI